MGSTAALLIPATAPAAVCGVTLRVKAAEPPAMPAAVVIVQPKSKPAARVPEEVQLAPVAPVLAAALL